MGITLYTNNTESSISEPDGYSPGFDTTSLRRAEIFTYTGIGNNLMPGEDLPITVGSPSFIDGTPFVSFSNNASVAHLNLGIPDSGAQTWFALFDPNNDASQRIVMGSYTGTSVTNHPGTSILISETGSLQLSAGYYDPSTNAYGTGFATMPAFHKDKPMLLCMVLDGKNTALKDLTNNVSTGVTFSGTRERSPAIIRAGKGGASLWGAAAATSRFGAYLVFDRVLSEEEQATVHAYLLRCVQAKFPSVTF
ncbi:TPA: hypothetical protein ACM9W1_000189 [Klebsiella pneumoniae]|mgnify:CR=1 FL=1|jgi:hypothetical protein|uniref:hypothetical protein n=2 Tax=Bacteria TaxID=2 RepID=UPI0022469C45|nr:hypothetical protein [Klebsiella pneumoniae]MCW9181002.1 hypothetical protein [Klebsiella pneumoniae]